MIIMKFEKRFPVSFFANLDFQRAIKRTLNRAEIGVEYSGGFTPHADVEFSAPIPLMLESLSEYAVINTAVCPKDFVLRFNEVAPKGLRCLGATTTEKGGLQSSTFACTYSVPVSSGADKIKTELEKDTFIVSYEGKDGKVEKDVKEKIVGYSFTGNKMNLTLRAGNDNLRIDRVTDELQKRTGERINVFDVVKTETFALKNGEQISFDRYWGIADEE